MDKRCGTCRYWDFYQEDEGYCRRYPPFPVMGKLFGQYPGTVEDHWCGEWQEFSIPNEVPNLSGDENDIPY